MFSNIGGKIKALAIITTIVGIFGSVVLGLQLMDYDSSAGLTSIIVGSLVSWIFSFFTYGFGEIVSQLQRSNELSQQILYKMNGSSAPVTSYPNPAVHTYEPANPAANMTANAVQNQFYNQMAGWTCSCGTVNSADAHFCKVCRGQKIQ